MLKIIALLIVVVVIGLIIYELNTQNAPTQGVEMVGQVEKDVVSTESSQEEVDPVPARESVVVGKFRSLDLSGQGLTETPSYVFGETNLEKLDLSNNKLTGSLQAEIRHLQALKVLDLSDNEFTGVPAEIGQLKNLEILDLSNNKITGLPLELGNLSKLKVLNLKGNQYSEFDLGLIREKLPASTTIEVD